MLFTRPSGYHVAHITRQQAKAISMDAPIGDPYGGPAYGSKEDWGTAVSVGSSLLGSALSSKSSSKAAQTQANAAQSAASMEAQAAQNAIDLQREQFDTSRSDLAPWRDVGGLALGRLSQMTGLNYDPQAAALANKVYTAADLTGDYLARYQRNQQEINGVSPLLQGIGNERMRQIPELTARLQAAELDNEKLFKEFSDAQRAAMPASTATTTTPYVFNSSDPSYAFRQSEGNKSIEAALRARGMWGSGGALKELTDYNSNLASQEYGNEFNRLSTLAGYGQNATNSGNTLGSQYAANVGNLTTSGASNSANALLAGANARASGYTSNANNLGATLGNIGGTLADWYKSKNTPTSNYTWV